MQKYSWTWLCAPRTSVHTAAPQGSALSTKGVLVVEDQDQGMLHTWSETGEVSELSSPLKCSELPPPLSLLPVMLGPGEHLLLIGDYFNFQTHSRNYKILKS